MRSSEIRKLASERCRPNSGTLACIWLVAILITSFQASITTKNEFLKLTMSFGSILVTLLLGGVIQYGLCNVVKMNYNGIKPELKNLFDGFNLYGKVIGLFIVQSLYIFLWSLLFIIPGIVKSYSYSKSFYILLDNPDLSINDCITKSKELMNGHKMDNFILDLSYIGWYLLSILTLGILTLWVGPKVQTSQYIFYRNIIGETNNLVELQEI